jgi:isopenicillin-N epimerase
VWDWICDHTGAHYLRTPIPLPLRDASEVVDALFAAASERTRAVYVSHVTSETALVLPVDEIVTRARELGLITIVDGPTHPRRYRSTSPS